MTAYLITLSTLAVYSFKTVTAAKAAATNDDVVVTKEEELENIPITKLADLYNAAAASDPNFKGSKIKKFSDKKAAMRRAWPVIDYLAKPGKDVPAGERATSGGKRGRRSPYAGMYIYKSVDGNPRKEGTDGHASWSVLTSGMKFETYIEKGGRARDLAWDISKGWARVAKEREV